MGELLRTNRLSGVALQCVIANGGSGAQSFFNVAIIQKAAGAVGVVRPNASVTVTCSALASPSPRARCCAVRTCSEMPVTV